MMLPKEGTPAYHEFIRNAREDPNSVEAKVIREINEDAGRKVQAQMRSMVYAMIANIPGQAFRDIRRFHSKFGLSPTEEEDHSLPNDLLKFRLKFLLEELLEYADAVGFELEGNSWFNEKGGKEQVFNAEKAFDGLIDLVYVALGTAFLHRFPFNEGWSRVQEANMAKVRADGAGDPRSHRGHSADIVKPEGWKPPILTDLLGKPLHPCECPLGPLVDETDLCALCGGRYAK